jgi:hypothetical protein
MDKSVHLPGQAIALNSNSANYQTNPKSPAKSMFVCSQVPPKPISNLAEPTSRHVCPSQKPDYGASPLQEVWEVGEHRVSLCATVRSRTELIDQRNVIYNLISSILSFGEQPF